MFTVIWHGRRGRHNNLVGSTMCVVWSSVESRSLPIHYVICVSRLRAFEIAARYSLGAPRGLTFDELREMWVL
jgi:hypothetical protein